VIQRNGTLKVASRVPQLRTRLAAASLALAAISLVGCSVASAGGSTTQGGAGQPAPAAAAPAGCKDKKASANIASVEELTAAFQSAGIPSADKWAVEVEEYRPYPEDPNWAKLTKELAKYNIAPSLLTAILSCLDR
jgi:hypothetical protein